LTLTPIALHHDRALEAVAPADGRDLEIQRRVPRVTALVHEHFGRLVLPADRDELFGAWVGFTEVNAEAALSVLKLLHVFPP
jgi:hypothetical protein